MQEAALLNHYGELSKLNTTVYGLSTQSKSYQQEAAKRLHLPFALLSDEALQFSKALSLPTMDVEGQTLIKRLTLICKDKEIKHVFYPVFPPDANADQVIEWLRQQKA